MIAPREARPTVKFVDEYCASYRKLFPEVRSFEAFQQLHVGIVSEIKRKTLPAIAEVVGLENSQSLRRNDSNFNLRDLQAKEKIERGRYLSL